MNKDSSLTSSLIKGSGEETSYLTERTPKKQGKEKMKGEWKASLDMKGEKGGNL